ncbi:MAG: tRNA (cytidine(56)-2'-O)-methyltransferase [Aigarchaeota archaeon]|nr:tRNA (cytidine(56)-2'-O)-methyltransferase [Aigarchaeota archaeon]MDW8092759.1 tRNA (cytidine(56)-2'-O)-methyltransferase [Nitrososphaerota archaeon]
MGRVIVLRLGHRVKRDQRVTTHVALTARALGASSMTFSGDYDEVVIKSVERVTENWGGDFKVEYTKSWEKFLLDFKRGGGFAVHLTMYGVNLPDVVEDLRRKLRERDLVLVVSSQKTPPRVYELADLNVAVTNQPHSEVAAVALAIDWLFEGRELSRSFQNARIFVLPSPRGKLVVRHDTH